MPFSTPPRRLLILLALTLLALLAIPAAGALPTLSLATLLGAAPSAGVQSRDDGEARDRKDKDRKKGKKGEEEKEDPGPLVSSTFSELKLRELGPALTSGRISDLAMHPTQPKIYYAAVASGGVWKTVNSGTTWTPIFDSEASYSIGCITVDPNNPLVIWVGTGENNSQRSVSYGDGVYKSVDGGKTWKNVGLKESEHIGMITVDPRDSDTVYVAAQGPLWSAGGDRGLYKTTDGGEIWERVLEIDEHTGVSEVLIDPRDPDHLYAVAYQRGRRVWTLINGGPGSAIYKSADAGENWRKLSRGLPKEDMGRIGLAVSPADPDVVYAIVEASSERARGVYRSLDAGESWERRDGYISSSPQYYQELVADPMDPQRVYSLDTFLMKSEDGGASWERAGEENKHVDNHALWIDPKDTEHLLVGCDGGIYESWDRAATWEFKPNLPLTQFYKIAVDNDEPFYNVYGGTQDNNTLGGPARTINRHGISNFDWYVTAGGDGFQPAIDPENPDIVYSESQYGGIIRYDRKTGERIDIRPREEEGDDPLRWNWDSPLIISPHRASRLYYAAQRVFRSEDRGDTWTAIGPDLSRQLDRNQLEIMGKLWGRDAVALHDSTSQYGSVVALSESPLVEGLVYASTDDGLVQVLDPGMGEWRKIDSFPGIAQLAYVADVVTSRHDGDTAFAVFNNHKEGDFKPYLLKTTDRGATWSSIVGDLPERGSTWVIAEDPVDENLLFVGTEFGLFFTVDGGGKWVQLKSGMPTIAVRDLAIQEREVDLVAGTFGRGFFVLDDYSPLRGLSEESLEQSAILFSVKDPWMFIEASPLTGSLGHSFFTTPNPEVGAVFTYYIKEGLESRRDKRKKKEKEAAEDDGRPDLPSLDDLRAEEREPEPKIVLTVKDDRGNVVRRIEGSTSKGIHRTVWDFRYPASTPVRLGGGGGRRGGFFGSPRGPLVAPGTYRVEMAQLLAGEWAALGGPQTFTAKALGQGSLPATDRRALLEFQQETAKLQRAVLGASRAADEAETRLEHLRQAAWETPEVSPEMLGRIDKLMIALEDLRIELEGDRLAARNNEPTPPSIQGRVQSVIRGHWSSTSDATNTHRRNYQLAADAFAPLLERLRSLIENDLQVIEEELEAAGAPWTPGRIPRWP